MANIFLQNKTHYQQKKLSLKKCLTSRMSSYGLDDQMERKPFGFVISKHVPLFLGSAFLSKFVLNNSSCTLPMCCLRPRFLFHFLAHGTFNPHTKDALSIERCFNKEKGDSFALLHFEQAAVTMNNDIVEGSVEFREYWH